MGDITMLTKLEIHGFKNLLNFEIDFGPFNCIAGENGVGKSNIFDAIQFLSLLADKTLMEAALSIRGTDPETADLRELFWTDGKSTMGAFHMAAEMIVEPKTDDDFGRPSEASSTYLRYEVQIGYEESDNHGTLGRLVLLSENLTYITEGEASRRVKFPHSAKKFRSAVVENRRRTKAGYITTDTRAVGETEILLHQEGNQGRPQRAAAKSAPRTIVATSNTSTTPTILAARREMQNWRLLALEPSAMRKTDRFYSSRQITSNGEHLPATLYRLATETTDNRRESRQVYARVASRLSDLVDVSELRVDVDQVRQLLALEAREDSGVLLPARSLSDGTLRFLALCVMAEDPSARGVICMEEPENGIHPAKMEAMVELLHDLVVDPQEPPDDKFNPLRQVIVATHSPAFVQLQNPDDLLFATGTQVRAPLNGHPTPTLRCRPLNGTWRTSGKKSGVDVGTILAYLTAPPGAQLRIDYELQES